MKVYLLLLMMSSLLIAIRMTSLPKPQPETLPQ